MSASSKSDTRPPRPSTTDDDQHLLYIRHRRKMNKRKLRAEQKRRTETLEDDVAALVSETNQLQHHLYDVATTAADPIYPVGGAMEGLLRHYFGLFVLGWDPARQEQLELELRTVLAPEVHFMDGRGIDKVVEQWRRCCMFYGAFHMTLVELVPLEQRYMRAHVRIAMDITDQTLSALYPQVLSHPTLPARLLGARLLLPVTCHIEMDEHFKVTRLDVAADYTQAFQSHVHGVDELAEVVASTQPTGELVFVDAQQLL
ncbi:hypothetical protein ACHHYP_14671 [Achlya hypogyna]|uniref:Bzip transcription factor n=1 Tax=Achlya hypogyna TaxID=1202772 RepID=A0A1V9YCQ5_ACHHY|nr:hypothetical protein ACHHYP_14671 [Achlya hypogyna]